MSTSVRKIRLSSTAPMGTSRRAKGGPRSVGGAPASAMVTRFKTSLQYGLYLRYAWPSREGGRLSRH